ncbi:MAG: adenosylmethionine decarboxylase [Burkholderiaceae bacterium]|nr:adenosylmethionine decarboxylase [Burkholderiaceae bacterium]
MQGLHLTADLHHCACPVELLLDARVLGQLCVAAVHKAGLQAVNQLVHTFPGKDGEPGGVTATVLLAESHLCVHTWPELQAVTLDVYVCNFGGDHSAKAHRLMDALLAAFKPGHTERHAIHRGELSASSQAHPPSHDH